MFGRNAQIALNKKKIVAACRSEGHLRTLAMLWLYAGRSSKPIPYDHDGGEVEFVRVDVKKIAADAGLKKSEVREVLNSIADAQVAVMGMTMQ